MLTPQAPWYAKPAPSFQLFDSQSFRDGPIGRPDALPDFQQARPWVRVGYPLLLFPLAIIPKQRQSMGPRGSYRRTSARDYPINPPAACRALGRGPDGHIRVPSRVRSVTRTLLRRRDPDLPDGTPLLRDRRLALLRSRRRVDEERDSRCASSVARRHSAQNRSPARSAVRAAQRH